MEICELCRFVDTEVDLDEEVKKFHSLAATPQLYGEFVASECLEKLISLVNHPNPDISLDVIDLLRELTDADNNLNQEDSNVLLKGLVRRRNRRG